MWAVHSAGRSAKWALGVFGGILLFYYVHLFMSVGFRWGRPLCAADVAGVAVVHKQFVGSCEVEFGGHHPLSKEVSGDELVLSQDGVFQSLGKEFQLFTGRALHDLGLTMIWHQLVKGGRRPLAGLKATSLAEVF